MKSKLPLFPFTLLLISSFSFGQQQDESAVAKLQKMLAARYTKVPVENKKFIYNAVDLNNDGKDEYLVGLIGGEFCGRAGCNMLVVNSVFKVITSMTIVQYPVYVEGTVGKDVTKGYKNLYLSTGGKGLVKVVWNGNSYPTNPSLAPAIGKSVVAGKAELLKATDQATYSF